MSAPPLPSKGQAPENGASQQQPPVNARRTNPNGPQTPGIFALFRTHLHTRKDSVLTLSRCTVMPLLSSALPCLQKRERVQCGAGWPQIACTLRCRTKHAAPLRSLTHRHLPVTSQRHCGHTSTQELVECASLLPSTQDMAKRGFVWPWPGLTDPSIHLWPFPSHRYTHSDGV
jgi:hypothetical protein